MLKFCHEENSFFYMPIKLFLKDYVLGHKGNLNKSRNVTNHNYLYINRVDVSK